MRINNLICACLLSISLAQDVKGVIVQIEKLELSQPGNSPQKICLLSDYYKPMGAEDQQQLATVAADLSQHYKKSPTQLHILLENPSDTADNFPVSEKLRTHLPLALKSCKNVTLHNAEICCVATAAAYIFQEKNPFSLSPDFKFSTHDRSCILGQISFADLDHEYQAHVGALQAHLPDLANPLGKAILIKEMQQLQVLKMQFTQMCEAYQLHMEDKILNKAFALSPEGKFTKDALLGHITCLFSNLFELTLLHKILTLTAAPKILVITGSSQCSMLSNHLRQLGAHIIHNYGSSTAVQPVPACKLKNLLG